MSRGGNFARIPVEISGNVRQTRLKTSLSRVDSSMPFGRRNAWPPFPTLACCEWLALASGRTASAKAVETGSRRVNRPNRDRSNAANDLKWGVCRQPVHGAGRGGYDAHGPLGWPQGPIGRDVYSIRAPNSRAMRAPRESSTQFAPLPGSDTRNLRNDVGINSMDLHPDVCGPDGVRLNLAAP